MSQSEHRRPELKGKDNNGCCPSCASRDFELSSPYQTKDEDEQYQDVYCADCGTVIDKQTT